MNQKNNDLETLISGMDITRTMHNNAESKYVAIAEYLTNNGIKCDIYPQGSFALGTVIKPYKEGKEQNYDLDFICLVKEIPAETDPLVLRNLIGNLLKASNIYSEKLTEYEKCWTLEYADINNIGFNMDIIPAINHEFMTTFIKITDKNFEKNTAEWIISNPKGYINWFESINNLYPKDMKAVDESYQNLPDFDPMKRTSLQKVIQILKVLRNHYYFQRKKENKKVISSIITTLCAKIAFENPSFINLDTLTLLEYIINELKLYSEFLNPQYINDNKKAIKRNSSKWEILNPVNEQDNLADQWNEDEEKAKLFFEWIDFIHEEYIDSDNIKYLYALQNAFGENYVNSKINLSTYGYKLDEKQETVQSKPWSCDICE